MHVFTCQARRMLVSVGEVSKELSEALVPALSSPQDPVCGQRENGQGHGCETQEKGCDPVHSLHRRVWRPPPCQALEPVEQDACVCVCAGMLSHCSVSDLLPHGLQPARLLCPRESPGKNAGVGCHAPLQGIFPTQGLNPCPLCLLHWRAVL